jgi:hypothetical protein
MCVARGEIPYLSLHSLLAIAVNPLVFNVVCFMFCTLSNETLTHRLIVLSVLTANPANGKNGKVDKDSYYCKLS